MGSKLCAQHTESLLSEKPGGFFDSITQGDTETGIALRYFMDKNLFCQTCRSLSPR